jgi:hypothetical protein
MNDVSNIPMNVTSTDLDKAIQEAALLAHVKISVWAGTRTDASVLEQLKQQHGATGDVGRMVKNTMAGADAPLKATNSAFQAVRTHHYSLTLPWVSDQNANRQTGPRLLPHHLFQRYLTEIGTLKREAIAKLDEFMPEYPSLVQRAKANLGGMADAIYPSEDEVRASFRIHQDFEPIPDGTGFRGLPENVIERLSHHLNRRQQNQITIATGAMWDEVKERVSRLVDRLADEDNKFKEASVRNVRELVTLLPGWNITNDPRVVEVTNAIQTMLDGVEAVDLRKDTKLRAATANDAKKITDKLAKWGIK